MSKTRTEPESLDEPTKIIRMEGALDLPMVSLSKLEIEERVNGWLNTALELHNADDVFVLLKQYDEAVSIAIDKLKPAAFDAFGNHFHGEAQGEVLGHGVKLSWPKKWEYSGTVTALQEKQKLELKALQLQEQANGIATQTQEKGRITVNLRKE